MAAARPVGPRLAVDPTGAAPEAARRRGTATLQGPFEIAGRRVRRGERLQFELPMAQLYTQTPLDMAVEVIHGRWQGPVLLVCAGIHGDELNGIEIIRRLRTLSSLDRLRGTLVLVPIVNLFGFLSQSRYLPDRRDLNRSFPGTEKGSVAARTANLFFRSVVSCCTHAVDLHTAAVNRENLPQIRAALDQPGVEAMARGFGIPVIVNSGLLGQSLRAEAGKIGIPVIAYEAGEALRLDEKAIVAGVRGVVNVMRTLDMLPARRSRTVRAEPYVANATSWFRSPSDGLFRPLARLGAHVQQGDTLGVVSAPFSADDMVLAAPFEGIVICVNRLPLVNEGDALFHLARFGAVSAVEGEIASHDSGLAEDPLYEIESVEDIEREDAAEGDRD
ncbi:MAG: succinylglutamate desuccinylase/aspartoacylase family protein [Gammaproteobacteria bacterium]|nr:succinylglutamate desuccinylase/aspartoacylase family protein [Gammaproteobacteria bacterium]MDE0440704.1 succinylglutamate desuccinylase/aspartoacylase family protein [Gammaproteobacteria bacterium]